jgi:RNA polymerase sigma-70 factor (ECF subfamily)
VAPARAQDDELRRRLEAGRLDRAAAWLVEQHALEVLALCRAMVRDGAAEDLAQEALGRAFVALRGYRGEASTRTWLLSIARNGCIDHLRARRRDPWAGGDEADPDDLPDEAPLPPDLLARRREVERALAGLAEGDRALVVLRFGHGFEYGELAETFGLREGAVRMRLSRALARMRAALEAPPRADAAAAPPAAAPRPAAPARPRLAAVARSLVSGLAAPPPGPAPAAAHPLTAVLAALEPGVSAALRGRLLAAARAVA